MIPYKEYQALIKPLTKDEMHSIIKINILDIEAGQGAFMASRVVETYFKEMLPQSAEWVYFCEL